MSIYSGFATRHQEEKYDECLDSVLYILQKRIIKFYSNEKADEEKKLAEKKADEEKKTAENAPKWRQREDLLLYHISFLSLSIIFCTMHNKYSIMNGSGDGRVISIRYIGLATY